MDTSSMPGRSPVRYQIPTHLNVPDRIALPLLGITVYVTIRQGLIFLLGWSMAFRLWNQLDWVSRYGMGGFVLRLLLPVLLAVGTCVVALMQIQDRYLEEWVVRLVRYHRAPKISLWRPVIGAACMHEEHILPSNQDVQRRSEEGEEDPWL